MITVSNTSPISNLAIIGRLELLRVVYGAVVIPKAVRGELETLGHAAAQTAIHDAERTGWLTTAAVSDQGQGIARALSEELDPGEAEAIALALGLGARLVMDELDGRAVARRLGIPVRGVLWVLRKGKEIGLIPSLRDELTRLRAEAHFWISSRLEAEWLRESGE
jgi:predicted nucleic acid-binding protein